MFVETVRRRELHGPMTIAALRREMDVLWGKGIISLAKFEDDKASKYQHFWG